MASKEEMREVMKMWDIDAKDVHHGVKPHSLR